MVIQDGFNIILEYVSCKPVQQQLDTMMTISKKEVLASCNCSVYTVYMYMSMKLQSTVKPSWGVLCVIHWNISEARFLHTW